MRNVTTELEVVIHEQKKAYLFIADKENFLNEITGNGFLPKKIFSGNTFKCRLTIALGGENIFSRKILFCLREQNASTDTVYEMLFIKELAPV